MKKSLIIAVLSIVLIVTVFFVYHSYLCNSEIRSSNVEYTVFFDSPMKSYQKDDSFLEAWIPLPSDSDYQTVSNIVVSGIDGYKITKDSKWSNKMIYFSSADLKLPKKILITYNVEVKENIKSAHRNKESGDVDKYLEPSAFAVHSERVKRISKSLAKTSVNETARSIYDYVLENMYYSNKDSKYGDVESLCVAIEGSIGGSGNCTDYHSLFSSLMQSQNIPARLLMGITLNPEGGTIDAGYHCWAEYLDGKTWYAVDISEASKNNDKKEYFFKSVDANRLIYSVGRDVILNPRQKGIALNFFGPYPYAELNGKVFNDFRTTISYN